MKFLGKSLLAGLLSTAVAPALAAPLPSALTFIGYGQSTMMAPGTNAVQGATCTFSTTSGGQVTISGVSGTPFSAAVPGAVISTAGLTAGSNPAITGFVSGMSGGNGVYSVNVSITLGPSTCGIANETTFMTLLTGSNVNPNAFMITTSPVLGPRGMWETLSNSNSSTSKTVLISSWSGFSLLKEAAYAGNYGNGSFFIESPMSSFAAQFIAGTGWTAPNAIIAENMSHGGQDWIGSYPNILAPGGNNDWTNFVTAQKYIKNTVQSNSGALPGITGPWSYHLGGVPMRLGESAAAAASVTATASFTTSTSGNTAIAVGSAPSTLNGVSQPVAGWCAYDATASAFIGYIVSWVSTTFTVGPTNSAVSSSGSTDSIYLSPCYPGYLAELKSMVAQFTISDVSDAPNPVGVPIFSALPSSSNFGGNEKLFMFAVNAANVMEAFADRRLVVTGPSFVGPYQSDAVHQEPQGNAIVGAYQGKWAAWNLSGKRTPPFAMIAAQRLGAGSVDGNGSHYGVRVTFQMPPSSAVGSVTAAQQQTLQFYTDSNIPSFTNYGFCYLDGAYPTGGTTFAMWTPSSTGTCLASASGISITGSPILATANSYTTGGLANQIDIPLTGDPGTATNPTITLGAMVTPNGVNIFGSQTHLFAHNVANKDCTPVANSGLSGKAFANSTCGTGNNYLVDFASPSFIGIGQTLTTAW